MTASNNHNKQHHQQLMHEQQQRRGGSEPPARPPAPAVEAVLAAAHNASARTSRVGGGGTLPGLKGVPLAHGGAQRLDVYLNGEHLIFASANLEHCLRISRITRQWDLIDRAAFDATCRAVGVRHLGCVYGIVGKLRLLGGWFLLVITQARPLGAYNSQVVFGIEDVELIPLHPSTLPKKLNAQSAVPRTAVPASVCCSDRSVVVKEQPRRSAHVAADTLAKLQRRSLPNGETRSTNGRGGGNGGGDGEKGEAHAGTEAGAINGGSRGTSTATEQKDGNKGGGGGVADGCAGVDEEDDVTPPLDPATRRIWDRLHRRHVKEIKKMFSLQQGGGFLFSLSGHILMSMQHLAALSEDDLTRPLLPHCDRHWWNKRMQSDLYARARAQDPPSSSSKSSSSLFAPWILPVVQGFFHRHRVNVGDHHISITVISRRSRHRLGCRYKRRGVDADGHVANSVETEQIVMSGTAVHSFVQYRGSIPVFWRQEQNKYEYRPACRITRTPAENTAAFAKHHASLCEQYGPVQYWVNLVNHHGRESVVGRAFARAYDAVSPEGLTYFAFDYHDKCKKNQAKVWDVADVGQVHLDTMGSTVFRAAAGEDALSSAPVRVQGGVVRTNCMDCLDRTNVTQSIIARRVLRQQLVDMGIIGRRAPLPSTVVAGVVSAWSANGNAISRQYAGTDAMKSEATKSSNKLLGALNDGRKSLTRYYLNTFHDAFRQQAIDLCQRARTCTDVAGEGVAMQDREQAALFGATMTFVQRVQQRLMKFDHDDDDDDGDDGGDGGEGGGVLGVNGLRRRRLFSRGKPTVGAGKKAPSTATQQRRRDENGDRDSATTTTTTKEMHEKKSTDSELPLVASPMWRQDEHIGVEVVLLLTMRSLIIAYVDFSEEAIISYTRLPLHRVCKVEVGSLSATDTRALGLSTRPTSATGLLASRRPRRGQAAAGPAALRIYVKNDDEDLVSRLVSGSFGVWYSDLLRLGLADTDDDDSEDDNDDEEGDDEEEDDDEGIRQQGEQQQQEKQQQEEQEEGQQTQDQQQSRREEEGGTAESDCSEKEHAQAQATGHETAASTAGNHDDDDEDDFDFTATTSSTQDSSQRPPPTSSSSPASRRSRLASDDDLLLGACVPLSPQVASTQTQRRGNDAAGDDHDDDNDGDDDNDDDDDDDDGDDEDTSMFVPEPETPPSNAEPVGSATTSTPPRPPLPASPITTPSSGTAPTTNSSARRPQRPAPPRRPPPPSSASPLRPRRPTLLKPQDQRHLQHAAPPLSVGGKHMHFSWCTLRPVQFNSRGHLEPTNNQDVIESVARGFQAVLQRGRHRFQLKFVKTLTQVHSTPHHNNNNT